MRRALFLGLFSIALLGCSSDDPVAVEIVSQDTNTTTAAPEAVEAVFPPVAEGIDRPAEDKIVDLRGQAVVEIIVKDNTFETRRFRVDPGTQLTFINRGFNNHNVIASAEGAFPEVDLPTPSTGPVGLILDVPGDYPFYCSFHGTALNGQTGYVIVGDG